MSPNAPDVSVLIVSYNTKDMTLDCIRSLIQETVNTTLQIIVIDNQSPDGSADAIAEAFPDVHLIRSEENLGFAKANNVAAQYATGDYILLLNPDTVVIENAVDRLMAFAREAPDAKIWGGRTVFADGTLNPTSCWGDMTPWSLLCVSLGLNAVFKKSELFNYECYGQWPRNHVRQVDIVTGCFLLMKRSFWEDLEGFDPLFFMYGEEADLCLRARHKGAKPTMTPEATIIHYGGASESLRADKMVKLYRGKITLARRHWSKTAATLSTILFRAIPYGRLQGYSLAHFLFRRPHHKAHADMWRTIWSRRQEWLKGY